MDNGDRIFNALVLTGWDIDVADNGSITAKKESSQLVGQIQYGGGAITWPDLPAVAEALHQARILELRAKAGEAKKAYEQANP